MLRAPLVIGLLLAGCVTIPNGPSVMVLPGAGKSFEQFQMDDEVCRLWAAQQIGIPPSQASAGGTAAAGAGVGLMGGTATGASRAEGSSESMQHRYDMTYMQCMYAKGNQIPVARGSAPAYTAPPPAAPLPPGIPPPPAGAPPPPPGSSR